MKEVSLESTPTAMAAWLNQAQGDRILVTRDGQPYALIVGLEHKDEEDSQLEASAEFWKMIEERRRAPTVPLADAEQRLFGASS